MQTKLSVLFLIYTVFPYLIGFANAKIVIGKLMTIQKWHFLTRFCFFSGYGKFVFNVTFPIVNGTTNPDLLLYYDAQDQWNSVYKTDKTCDQKKEVLSTIENATQVIQLNENNPLIRCKPKDLDGKPHLECICVGEFVTQRERWWYLVASNCNSSAGLILNYNLTMLNTKTYWLRHFSADEYAVFPQNIVSLFTFCIILIVLAFQSVQLYERRLLHSTFKLFIFCVLLETFGLLLLFVYYYYYATNGKSSSLLRMFANMFIVASSMFFMLLVILIAKGYTVTRARLKPSTSVKISTFMSIYAIIYVFIYFYEQYFFDPAQVLYTYESWLGYCLIVLRFIGLSWFSQALFKTCSLYPTKRGFFTIFYVMYSMWFISTPCIIIFSTFVIPKYQREQLVTAFENAVVIRANLIFMALTWPSKINRCFPFHVRTTQIGAMEKSNVLVGSSKVTYVNKRTGTAGGGDSSSSGQEPRTENSSVIGSRYGIVGESLDHFNHYQYAPTSALPKNAIILRQPSATTKLVQQPVANSTTILKMADNYANTNPMPDVG